MSASAAGKLVICGDGGGEGPLLTSEENHISITVGWSMPRWRKSIHSAARRVGGPLAGMWEPYRPWMRLVLKAIPTVLHQRAFRPDVIVTFGHPWVDHEIGLALQQLLRLPWIAHFSDPWVDNPLVGARSPSARSALRRRESSVVQNADRLVFTSDETIELVMGNYPERYKSRAVVLPHCFDPKLFPSEIAPDESVVRCLGKFYGDRQPDVLFEALERIDRETPGKLDTFKFEIIGNYEPRASGSSISESARVRFRSPVSYLESLRLMASAGSLFLVDAPAEKSVFLPSKLIEYIGARRPVFGITPAGTADNLIRRYGGMTADPADVAGVARMISDFLDRLPSLSVDLDVRNEFSMDVVGRRFDEIVHSTITSNRHVAKE